MAKRKTLRKMEPNTIEINPDLASITTFDEKIITEAGFKLISITLNGEAQLDNCQLKEIEIDKKYRIGVSQTLRRRYHMAKITDNFTKRLSAIRTKVPANVCVSLRTITIKKGKKIYSFRVYGKKTKSVILRHRNKDAFELLDVEELQKELCELFETTCFLKPGKYKTPMLCGLNIK